MKEIVLINITGPDRPGLTAAITGLLAKAEVNILDIGQAVIHDTLSFGILVEMTGEEGLSDVLKDVLFRGYELDQQVRFTPVSAEEYGQAEFLKAYLPTRVRDVSNFRCAASQLILLRCVPSSSLLHKS